MFVRSLLLIQYPRLELATPRPDRKLGHKYIISSATVTIYRRHSMESDAQWDDQQIDLERISDHSHSHAPGAKVRSDRLPLDLPDRTRRLGRMLA